MATKSAPAKLMEPGSSAKSWSGHVPHYTADGAGSQTRFRSYRFLPTDPPLMSVAGGVMVQVLIVR